jgi:hypothetical protein
MSELTTTLNLFKSQDKEVHKIAYELLNNRLPQELNRDFLENLMKYFETADHVPGKFHNLMYMKLLNILEDSTMLNIRSDLLKKNYDNLLYSTFVKECVADDEGSGCDIDHERYIIHDEMYQAYQQWHKEQNLDNICTKDELRNQLKVVLKQGPCFGDKWLSRRLCSKKELQEEITLLKEKCHKLEESRHTFIYSTFVKDCLIKVEESFISHDDIFEAYRKWFKEQCFTFKCCPKFELKHKLEALWSQKLLYNKWSGYALRFPKENENITKFLDEMTQEVLNGSVTLGDIYKAYCKWSKGPYLTIEKFSGLLHKEWDFSLKSNSNLNSCEFRGYCLKTVDNTATTFIKLFIAHKPGYVSTLETFYNAYYKWCDSTLLDKLDFETELKTIWGCKIINDTNQYHSIGLTTSFGDEIYDFVNERTEICLFSDVSISFDELYNDYLKWTDAQYPFTKAKFRDELHTILLLPRKVSDNFVDNYHCRRLRETKIIYFIRDKIVKDKNSFSTLENLYDAYCEHELNVNKIYPFNKQYFTEQIYATWGVKPDSEGKYHGIRL